MAKCDVCGKGVHFGDDAAIRFLFPPQLGRLVLQVLNLVLVALDQTFDHPLRIHAAGQAADDVCAVIQTAGIVLAARAADRCHFNLSFITR